MKRKHISWKTKLAAALLDAQIVRERWGLDPERWYRDAKKMTEDQFLSLFQWDHGILHESGHEDRDKFWNLTPRLILEHRQKTKVDAKVIAKGKRIRDAQRLAALRRAALLDVTHGPASSRATAPRKATIKSRGFDKRYRKKMDGTVVKRDE